MTTETRPTLTIVPCSLKVANDFVANLHRPHQPVRNGYKFCVAGSDGAQIRGVAIVGLPVARFLMDGYTLEVRRVCTDGCPNACSALYGAARRIAKAMGYKRLITSTLPEEGGASLRGAGWRLEAITEGGSWDSPSRPRTDKAPTTPKHRWVCDLVGTAVTR